MRRDGLGRKGLLEWCRPEDSCLAREDVHRRGEGHLHFGEGCWIAPMRWHEGFVVMLIMEGLTESAATSEVEIEKPRQAHDGSLPKVLNTTSYSSSKGPGQIQH